MHSTHIPVSVSLTAQSKEKRREEPKEIRLDYDRSIPLYERAQEVGVPNNPVSSFLFKDQGGLESIGVLDLFFYVRVPKDMHYIKFIAWVEEEIGPCIAANLEETVAFLRYRELFGWRRVACINSGVMNMDCVRPLFVSFRQEPGGNPEELVPKVSRPDAKIVYEGNIILFKKKGGKN